MNKVNLTLQYSRVFTKGKTMNCSACLAPVNEKGTDLDGLWRHIDGSVMCEDAKAIEIKANKPKYSLGDFVFGERGVKGKIKEIAVLRRDLRDGTLSYTYKIEGKSRTGLPWFWLLESEISEE